MKGQEQVPYQWSFGCESAASSSSNTGGGGGLLDDIFQVLSEVPLHATEALHDSRPHYFEIRECISSGACTACATPTATKGEGSYAEHKEAMELHENRMMNNVIRQGCEVAELGVKEVDISHVTMGYLQEKQPIHATPNHKSNDYDHHDHVPTRSSRRSREQKRRERINAKLRALQALIPSSDKGDHASILGNAINCIKSLKLHIEMLYAAWSIRQGEHQAPYMATPPMMQMIPRHTAGQCEPPWPLQMPMTAALGYPPRMIPPPSFPVQVPIISLLLAPQTITSTSPPLSQPSTPINLCHHESSKA